MADALAEAARAAPKPARHRAQAAQHAQQQQQQQHQQQQEEEGGGPEMEALRERNVSLATVRRPLRPAACPLLPSPQPYC